MTPTRALSRIQLRDVIRRVEHDGFAMVSNIVDDRTIDAVLSDLSEVAVAVRRNGDRPYGIRNFVNLVPAGRALATREPVTTLVRAILGDGARLVRSLFFDKLADANWSVAWHQDRTIAVRRRIDVDGFGPWTVKGGVPHVQPPDSVLKEIVTLRIHLDDADEFNGALKVIPGSHRLGRLSQARIEKLTKVPTVNCVASRGSILVIRPLLLHSSSACAVPTHRRVVHLEFAGAGLPLGLEWNEN